MREQDENRRPARYQRFIPAAPEFVSHQPGAVMIPEAIKDRRLLSSANIGRRQINNQSTAPVTR